MMEIALNTFSDHNSMKIKIKNEERKTHKHVEINNTPINSEWFKEEIKETSVNILRNESKNTISQNLLSVTETAPKGIFVTLNSKQNSSSEKQWMLHVKESEGKQSTNLAKERNNRNYNRNKE